MKRLATLMMLGLISTGVLTGCGTSGPTSAPGLRNVVGTDLIGARGATAADQRKIDRTVVGICSGEVWSRAECARHGDESRSRKAD